MNIEDRVRAATRARADLVRDIRPLTLPGDLLFSDDRAERAGRLRGARQVRAWVIPLAVAAVVVALALTLVAVRQAAAPRQGPPPAAPAAVLAKIPRYYAVISPDRSTRDFSIVDDHTGKTVVDFAAPGDSTLEGVSVAASDRTFLLTFRDSNGWTVWAIHLLLRTGLAYSAEAIPIPRMAWAGQLSASISPNGREVAILSLSKTGTTTTTAVNLYPVSPKSPLAGFATWTTTSPVAAGADLSTVAVSWLSDNRHLAFNALTAAASAAPQAKAEYTQERELDTAGPSGDLLSLSRVVFTRSQLSSGPCGTLRLTPDGGTAICGTRVAAGNRTSATYCGLQGPSLIAYSARTGKQVRAMARNQQPCSAGSAIPVWSDSGAGRVIGVFPASPGGFAPTQLVVFADGRPYSLPLPMKPVSGSLIAF